MGRTVRTMCLALVMILLFSEIAYSTPLPKINAQGAVLMDAKTGQVIYEKTCISVMHRPAPLKL